MTVAPRTPLRLDARLRQAAAALGRELAGIGAVVREELERIVEAEAEVTRYRAATGRSWSEADRDRRTVSRLMWAFSAPVAPGWTWFVDRASQWRAQRSGEAFDPAPLFDELARQARFWGAVERQACQPISTVGLSADSMARTLAAMRTTVTLAELADRMRALSTPAPAHDDTALNPHLRRPEQPMTVAELIAALQACDPGAAVLTYLEGAYRDAVVVRACYAGPGGGALHDAPGPGLAPAVFVGDDR